MSKHTQINKRNVAESSYNTDLALEHILVTGLNIRCTRDYIAHETEYLNVSKFELNMCLYTFYKTKTC